MPPKLVLRALERGRPLMLRPVLGSGIPSSHELWPEPSGSEAERVMGTPPTSSLLIAGFTSFVDGAGRDSGTLLTAPLSVNALPSMVTAASASLEATVAVAPASAPHPVLGAIAEPDETSSAELPQEAARAAAAAAATAGVSGRPGVLRSPFARESFRSRCRLFWNHTCTWRAETLSLRLSSLLVSSPVERQRSSSGLAQDGGGQTRAGCQNAMRLRAFATQRYNCCIMGHG